MKTALFKIMKPFHTKSLQPRCEKTRPIATAALVLFCASTMPCLGQGTMTFAFEGQPRGTVSQLGSYTESGMRFSLIHPMGSLFLSGGGFAARPDNGTGYLEIPDANVAFQFTSGAHFDLLSFDAAELGSSPPPTLQVVGYRAMGLMVTNIFTLDGVNDGTGPLQDFQTVHLDSQFQDVYRVDVLNGAWSLDNLAVGGVPEPSTGTLLLLAMACAFGRSRIRRSRP
jgi:hypothetical protein